MLFGKEERQHKEEFSDESLFGEDRIEDLIERKSMQTNGGRGVSGALSTGGMAESFKSRGNGFNIRMAQEDMLSQSNHP